MNQKKLEERCLILEELIISTAKIYNSESTSLEQKALLETIIGAAIWYLPSGQELWTGKMSVKALEHIKEGKPKSQLTKEHKYPRKQAGKQLLTIKYKEFQSGESKLVDLYLNEYGKYNYVLKSENRQLVTFQKDSNFIDDETAYKAANIILLDAASKES
ncbi:hypothetical protein [Rufibacter quisquiliarum]|uniref:Uncharacterized protein n=1 Tax=Rufibacter quisquiliarum TaxID=1549639 RepID=A0A839GLR9_9BACT|nr:hypothetical protein [Rufibacter quisquiliarum]MBA9075887.1 hypothetical protein [Rufibacter quisquiliarum]